MRSIHWSIITLFALCVSVCGELKHTLDKCNVRSIENIATTCSEIKNFTHVSGFIMYVPLVDWLLSRWLPLRSGLPVSVQMQRYSDVWSQARLSSKRSMWYRPISGSYWWNWALQRRPMPIRSVDELVMGKQAYVEFWTHSINVGRL